MDDMKNNSPIDIELEYRPFPSIKSKHEFESAMIADATTFTDERTGKIVCYGDYRKDIFAIEHFVLDINKRDDQGFTWIYPKIDPNTPPKPARYDGSRFIRAMYKVFRNLPKRRPEKVRFSVYIELYFDTLSEMNLTGMLFMNPEARVLDFEPYYKLPNSERLIPIGSFGDLFNEFIKRIKEAATSDKFKKRVRRRIYRSKENLQSASAYIDSLFKHYSRLVIIRVDFLYRSGFAHKVTIKQAQKDREHFLNNRRNNKLFDHLAGYVWKLEDGEERGLHYHFILILDGSYKENASYYANEFGKYWVETVTKGRGFYHSCHTPNASYKHYAIGTINHYEADKRANLKGKLLEYITKTSQYVRVIGGRVFGHGEISKKPISKTGNPCGSPRKYDS